MKGIWRLLQAIACVLALGTGASLYADWPQWGHDPQHSGYIADVEGPDLTSAEVLWSFTVDNRELTQYLIHYAVPLVDGSHNVYATEREQVGSVVNRRIAKLDPSGTVLWRYQSDPDNRYEPSVISWESVFHGLLANGYLYVPAARGVLEVVDAKSGAYVGSVSFYEVPQDPDVRQQLKRTVFVAGVPTADANGNVYFTVWVKSGAPLDLTSQLVKVAPDFTVSSVGFLDLMEDPNQRPAPNAAPAVAADGTIYIVSRRDGVFGDADGWVVAVNPDLTFKWRGSLALLPDKIARVNDSSSSSPIVDAKGRVYYGGVNTNGLSRGYVYAFNPDGQFYGYYDFGWDITPATYEKGDRTFIVLKDNHYDGFQQGPYFLTTLDADTLDGDRKMTVACQWELRRGERGYEWCINAPAIDQNATIYGNGEDGYLYALQGMFPDPGQQCAPVVTSLTMSWGGEDAYTADALDDGVVYAIGHGKLYAVGYPGK